ncbi:MAG TPA: DUF3352 domain-containing protein [Solirubrobacterales bacterium]|nr:DUF3352 domain-containing protein [Solirubrobacterales bacterium]
MRASLKVPALVLTAVLAAAIVVAGCGGSSGGGGEEPASLAPEKAPVYLEVDLGAEGKTSEEFNELANNVLGIENVGEFIAEKLEQQALGEGEKFNFEAEVEPWLGEKAGMYLTGYDGDEFTGYGVAIETTNTGETEEFIEKRVKAGDEETEEGEFEGHKYYVEPGDESVLGVIGDYLAFGETKANFEEMVKISEAGEGLNGSSKFKTAMEGVESGGIGSVYVDIGGLIEEAKGLVPAETEAFFDLLQIEPKQATAVAGVIPHAEQVEVNLSTTLGKTTVPSGDATPLLESLPATAVAAFASPDVGKSLGEGIDELDEQGIPGQIGPGELKPALETVGIDLDSIAASIGDVGGFVEGAGMGSLGGAVVIDTSNAAEAKNTVGNIGLLLRVTGTKGVTAIGGKVSGFSIHSAKLGRKPVIVGASDEKVVISYGPKAAAQALRSSAKTLGSTADFEAAKSSLGSTPMTSFIDGRPALRLVESLLSPVERAKFAAARPYLQKVSYVGVGSEAKGEATTAKVIVGLQK